MNKRISKNIIVVLMALLMLAMLPLTGCDDKRDVIDEGIAVILNYNDESSSRPRRVFADENGAIAEPAVPERKGYTFAYWQTAPDGGARVNFPFTPAADTTLYARWEARKCTVTFDFNYEGSSDAQVAVTYNDTVAAPTAIPERNNYNFRYWRTLPDGGAQVSFPYTVRGDVTFYAYWLDADVKIYNIAFDANYEGAEKLESTEAEEGKEIEFPSVKRTGYKLVGWAVAPDGEPVGDRFVPTSDCTLYALWQRQEYTVTFNYNYVGSPDGGKFVRNQIYGGDPIHVPDSEPTRPGYSFLGWYTNAEGGTEVRFPIDATRSTTYYAHWKHDPVETDIFDAEFVEFDPTELFPGYSGSAQGKGVIQSDLAGSLGASTQYGDGMSGSGRYVSFMFKRGATLTFNIDCSEAVSGVTLVAPLSSELKEDLIISSAGDFAYQFVVNGSSVDYGGVNVGRKGDAFKDVTIATNISLVRGPNVIQLITANDTPMGGIMTATAPIVDCIKLQNYGGAKLTWSPVYDNLV